MLLYIIRTTNLYVIDSQHERPGKRTRKQKVNIFFITLTFHFFFNAL